ncbi:MAG: glycosyltransferase [Steroidobacteraceae bacterium]
MIAGNEAKLGVDEAISEAESVGGARDLEHQQGGAILALAHDLAQKEREILLLQQDVALLEVEIEEATGRLANQRADHGVLAQRMHQHVESLRIERDDLIMTARMLREKLSDLADYRTELEYREAVTKTGPALNVPRSLQHLRVAGIMDEFTFNTFFHSCDLCLVDVADWEQQLAVFKPELLIVESAWHGNDGQWTRKINHPSRELKGLLEWCARNGVPTAFWNKEDPVHFDTFINTAKLFDHVFTTDLDCIGSYKTLLGHDRAHLLPFWGQPRLHSPVERFERKDAFCFAGAYYVRYPERQRDFDTFISTLEKSAPVEIFDRNHGKDDPNYQFPDHYRRLIKGTLTYTEIDRAYKGYAFGINLNSVKQSQSMFARRAFDLMLSNTHVVSNYSRGLRLMFGDLVTSTDSGTELAKRLRPMFEEGGTVSYRRTHRLLALRKVMLEHTADNRIAYILSKVGGRDVERELPSVVVAACVGSDADMARVIGAYDRQQWQRKRLVLVLPDGFLPANAPTHGRRDISLLMQRDAEALAPSEAWPGELVAFFSTRDFYGKNYLTDSALAFLYSPADVVGKGAWYEASEGCLELQGDGRQYHWQETLPLRRTVAAVSALAGSSMQEWVRDLDIRRISGRACLALDEFGYVADADRDTWPELDEPSIDTGLPIRVMLDQAEAVRGAAHALDIEHGFDAKALGALFGGDIDSGAIRLKRVDDAILVRSLLGETEHKYTYASRLLTPDELSSSGDITFNLVAMPGLHLDVVLIFLASDGSRLGQAIKPFGRNHVHTMPNDTTHIRLGLRVLGPGAARIAGLSLRPLSKTGPAVPQLGRERTLLLTNIYPSAEHLYRNGFVHRRVLGYRGAGIRTDVFVFNPRTRPHSYEFNGIDVGVGGMDRCGSLLDSNPYDSILVHFLNSDMWAAIKNRLHNTRVIVWVHGSDIQPWHRRAFNYLTEDALTEAKAVSEVRMSFWSEVFRCEHPNLHFVFVSRYLADTAMEDVGVVLDGHRYDVIHNFVDSDLFSHVPKPESQRYKVLSIRPYSSRTYANDLAVKAILSLRHEPFFESMEFRLIGEGALFEDTVEPLTGLSNVVVENRFLAQSEIAGIHKDYGIFLCPTRMDSQGVSRDEAMSSGLVPVTNAVAAIPEFVDERCGILAKGENWAEMAEGIAKLVADPDHFTKLSEAAARRVRAQSGFDQTIAAEARLIAPFPPQAVL